MSEQILPVIELKKGRDSVRAGNDKYGTVYMWKGKPLLIDNLSCSERAACYRANT